MDIAERIKIVRGNLSQDDFALKLGIHKSSLGRYERGDSVPGVDFAESLCFVFGISPQWFIFGTGPMHLTEAQHAELNPPMGIEPDIIMDVVEVLEEYLAGRGTNLRPNVKAKVVREMCLLVAEHERENAQPASPAAMMRLINTALADCG